MEPKISVAPQIGGTNMVDITGAEHEVEVLYREGVLWVNIDGVCRLRCCQMQKAELIFDIRHSPKTVDIAR